MDDHGEQSAEAVIFQVIGDEALTLEQIASRAGVTVAAIRARWTRGLKGSALIAPRYTRQASLRTSQRVEGRPKPAQDERPPQPRRAVRDPGVDWGMQTEANRRGIPSATFEARFKAGWPTDRLLDPVRQRVLLRVGRSAR